MTLYLLGYRRIDTFFSLFLSFSWQNRSMVHVYGIPNCDTVKKARAWLTSRGLAHTFHDFKKQGVPAQKLPTWASAIGWDKLINRQGTTWRKLDAALQASAHTSGGATALMMANPGVIKRPVVDWGAGALTEQIHSDVTVGFDPQLWAKITAA